MDNISVVESVLELVDLYYENTSYHFEPSDNHDLSFNFTRSITELNDDIFRVSLQCDISSPDNMIKLHDELIGIFKCESENEELKKQLITKNSIAIMFPYLRSHIVFITSQPKRIPINLPTVNINQMFDDAEKSK